MKGKDVVSNRVAQIWFKRFTNGDMDLVDKSRSGRPMTMDSEAIRESIEANPSNSTRRLSTEFDIPQTLDVWHLHALGKVNRCCREVPHDLTKNQAERRVEMCQRFLVISVSFVEL